MENDFIFVGKVTGRTLERNPRNLKVTGMGALHNLLEKVAECLYKKENGEKNNLSRYYSSAEVEEIIKWEDERVDRECSNLGRW